MKAKRGDRIRLIQSSICGSAIGLMELPKGTELIVADRMLSNDGIKTVELFRSTNPEFPDDTMRYGIFDYEYEVI